MKRTYPESWKTIWRTKNIWEDSDHVILKGFKAVCYGITFLIGMWLVPLRDVFVGRTWAVWKIPTWLLNNVPNGITLLIRGCLGVPSSVALVLSIWLGHSLWLTPVQWFWVVVLMFCTDFIDGPLARQLAYVTDFGREADPTIDKIISAVLAIGLAILSVKFYGVAVGMVLIPVLIWLIWVEQDVARISMRTRKLSRQLKTSMHGAFGAGKIKFTLEAIALGAGFGWFVWAPTSLFGILVAIGLFIPARFFADKSRGLHRLEELDFRAKLHDRDYSNVVPLRDAVA